MAERKDVLSGFFFLWRCCRRQRGGIVAARPLFSAPLLRGGADVQPMVVTLPVVLLLDFRQPGQRPGLRRCSWRRFPPRRGGDLRRSPQLVQTRATSGPAPLALPAPCAGDRLLRRTGRAVRPTGLPVSYPPEGLPVTPAQVVLAAGALAAASWLALRARNQRRPGGSAGCGFLVMLLPVLDLVQGGMR
ncbi:MAG: hypothetical protein IPO18_09255 [bacterium]|nr:hypothetical protein [bacterium]